ncbi:MAG: RDD family protein [Candidatus Micrarchaeota archaeon]
MAARAKRARLKARKAVAEKLGTAKAARYAGFWVRLAADIVDTAIVIAGILLLDRVPVFGPALLVAWIFGYGVYFVGSHGATPGKRLMGLHVVRIDGRRPVGYGIAFLREVIGKAVSWILLGLGLLLIAFDDRKQGLHDKIAETLVVYSE